MTFSGAISIFRDGHWAKHSYQRLPEYARAGCVHQWQAMYTQAGDPFMRSCSKCHQREHRTDPVTLVVINYLDPSSKLSWQRLDDEDCQ